MAKIEEHAKDCKYFLDKSYWEVHKFLDQYASFFPVGNFVDYHRTFLHNSYGIKVVEAKWGAEAKIAALIHLYRDYYEGPIKNIAGGIEEILKRSKTALTWFNKMQHGYEPPPDVARAWKGKGLVYLCIWP